jgi:diguanylate cyclase (GGDEF)-like protein/PAS domain S-box-containing protein
MALTDLVDPANAADVLQVREQLEAGDARRVTQEREYRRRNGSFFLGRAHVSAVHDEDGRVAYLLGVLEDITEARRAADSLAESEARYRALVDHSPDIIITMYPDGEWNASNAGTVLLGHPKGLDVEGGALSLVHPDDLEKATATLSQLVSTPGMISPPVELRLRAADGRYLEFECVGQNLDSNDAVGGVVVTARYIAERKRLERALHAAEEQFRAVFEHAPFSVSVVDLEGNIVDINYAGCAMLGRTRQELTGTSADAVVHPDDRERAVEYANRQLAGNPTPAEFRVVRADGTAIWVMSNASLLDPGGDEEPYVVSVQADITERRLLETRLAHEATRDQLTGVMNRGAIVAQLELALLQRLASPLGMLFVDLDYFKGVNDRFGHEAGDAVLSTIAKRIQDAVREGDVVGRFGGDEFVVLCHDVNGLPEACDVADRVREAVAREISIRGGTATVDASVGVALGNGGDDAAELLRRADQACYRAKQAGRGRVAAATDAPDEATAGGPDGYEEIRRSA